jgi:hypothetical protein
MNSTAATRDTHASPVAGAAAVLLVDDRPEKLHALEALLAPLAAEMGVRVLQANSGEEALCQTTLGDDAALLTAIQRIGTSLASELDLERNVPHHGERRHGGPTISRRFGRRMDGEIGGESTVWLHDSPYQSIDDCGDAHREQTPERHAKRTPPGDCATNQRGDDAEECSDEDWQQPLRPQHRRSDWA